MNQDAIWFRLPPPSSVVPAAPEPPVVPEVELTIDGTGVSVAQGATVLDACLAAGRDIPTLCYLETLTPVNACRVCVVELEGARVLVPACSRKAEAGMKIHTDSPRVRTAAGENERPALADFPALAFPVLAPRAPGWAAACGSNSARSNAPRSASSSSSRNAFTRPHPSSVRSTICDDPTMKHVVVKTIANAGALAVAIWLLRDITLTGENTGRKILTLILVALLFGELLGILAIQRWLIGR